jgi:hypothetical protein
MDFAESIVSGPHARLAELVGDWTGTATLWFRPGDPSAVDDITLRIEPVADGRSLRLTYTSAMDGQPSAGELLVAYHLDEATWQAAWSDSKHTGTLLMMFSGAAGPDDPPRLEGSYGAGDAVWGWNITFGLDGDELLVAHDNVPTGMDPIRALEWRCRRAS